MLRWQDRTSDTYVLERTGILTIHAMMGQLHSPSPQCSADQRERNPTASGGQLPVPVQYLLPKHENRRRSGPQDFKDQSSLWPPSKHSLKSSWSPAQQEAEDVQGRHPPDVAVRIGDMDGIHEGTPTQPVPPHLSSSHPEAEVAGPNP
ncbi:hypothetical protein SprV_0301150500 [Sparganum proliferum]